MAQTTARDIPRLRFHAVWITLGWMLVLFIVYESLTPHPVELEVEQGDKLGHFAAYLVLMSWFANVYHGTGERALCVLGCLALGVGLEFAQRLTATRSFEFTDMAAGAAGVLIGLMLAPPRLPNYLRFAERFARTSDE
jgi:VanZ family protein